MKKSLLNRFGASFFYSTIDLGIFLKESTFSNFLSTSIYYDTLAFNNGVFYNRATYEKETDDSIIMNCIFKKCKSTGKGGAFVFHSKVASLKLKKSAFIQNSAENCGAFSVFANSFFMLECCSASCRAVSRFQFFKCESTVNSSSESNLSFIDQASWRPSPGLSVSYSVVGDRSIISDINVTRCVAKEVRCLGQFGAKYYLHYRYINNVNGSSHSYLHFHISIGGQTCISDSNIIGCKAYHQEIEHAITYDGVVEIYRFAFIRSQMILLVQRKDNSYPGSISFIDCMTDLDKDKMVSIKNEAKIKEMFYKAPGSFDMLDNFDFASWKCATFIPPTSTPGLSPTDPPPPTSTPKTPRPTVANDFYVQSFEKPVITFISNTKNGKISLIFSSFFVLVFIVAYSFYVFRIKFKPKYTQEEEQTFFQKK